jgi:zinc protease
MTARRACSARLAAVWLAMIGLLLPVVAQATPPVQHWTHANGAQVYWVQDHTLPMLDVQIDVDGGARREPAAQAGLAEAAATLLQKGSLAHQGRPALDENQVTEAWVDLGAQFQVSATSDRFSVQLRTLTDPDILPQVLALAQQQLAAPAWPQAVWQRERARWVAAWQDAQTRPETLAERLFSQAVYGRHPYGTEATPTTWATIDTSHMRDFYRKHAQICQARVTVVGAVDRAQADRVVTQLLAGWQAHGCRALPPVPEVKPLMASVTRKEAFQAAQAQVLVGQPGIKRSDPDYFPITVGNHILGGGGFASRLMQEIREKRGLTYGVYSYFSPARHAAAFTVSLQTRPDQAEQVVQLIHAALQEFVQNGPSSTELDAAKASLVNGFALRIDSNRKLLDSVASMAWNNLPLDYLDRWTEQIDEVTPEQVRRAFQRVLQPDRLVTVVVGGQP